MNTPFQNVLAEWPPERVTALIASATDADVCRARADTGRFDPQRLAALLSPAARPGLEAQAQVASAVTRRRFGWAMQFFAPLYVSNYCCNSCVYCGFNRAAAVARRALSLDEAEAEADWLARQGFAHLLLVAGDDRRHTPPAYFEALVRRIAGRFASKSTASRARNTSASLRPVATASRCFKRPTTPRVTARFIRPDPRPILPTASTPPNAPPQRA
jgi:2-iminoacetate synthase